MNTYDVLLLARLRASPRGLPRHGSPIPLSRLSAGARAELEELIAALERRTRLRAGTGRVRANVLELLGIEEDQLE